MAAAESPGCPACHSQNIRAVLPADADAFTYRCRDCQHVWHVSAKRAAKRSSSKRAGSKRTARR